MPDFLRFTCDLNDPATTSAIDECSLWGARFGLFLLDQLTLQPDMNILDLACGTGFPLFELAHICGPSCRVTGVDTWKEGIERARAKQQIYQLPNVQLLEADGEQLPLQDHTFDLIVSNLGINNFAHPSVVFAECFRVAKPAAHIALTTNTIGHMAEFYEIFRQTLLELQKPVYLERLREEEAHRGTKESVREQLSAAGFRIVKVKEDQFQLRYLNGSAFFNHWLTKLGFLESWRQVVDQDDEEQVFTLLEHKLNQLASEHGELRMTVPMLYVEGEKSA